MKNKTLLFQIAQTHVWARKKTIRYSGFGGYFWHWDFYYPDEFYDRVKWLTRRIDPQ